jgi:glycosyltransferase involved in cell wall biosynthesis
MISGQLRVLFIGYSLLPISERSCGGAEQVLLMVESQIHHRGHATVVAACSGSRVAGELFATGDPPCDTDSFERRNREHISRVLEFIYHCQQSQPFDLIHDHGGSFWRHATAVDVPVLATLHLPRPFYPETSFAELPDHLTINCVSHSQAKHFQDVPQFAGVVRNGVEVDRFPYSEEKGDYLLWLGRFCHEKGPHVALDVARECHMPIVLAGEVYPFSYHQHYFEQEILPRLQQMSDTARWMSGISLQQKLELLRGARAVLIPSLVDETSSLVAMEAMGCGTPVISLRCGALPEVVADGSTGFVVESPEEMVQALAMIDRIKPRACRARVQREFSASRMAGEYHQLYGKLISAHQRASVEA